MTLAPWMTRARLRAAASAAVAVIAVYAAGLIWFAEDIPRLAANGPQTTDAIVVLTGGQLRLKEGLALMSEGRAKKLFVSGVNRGVELNELLRVAGQTPPAAACCIVLGYSADNTVGNAQETRLWLESEGFHSLRLVTANYHMRRSLLEFRRAMPGTEILPHPVFPDSFKREDWWQRRGTLLLIFTEYNKFLAAFARSLIEPISGPYHT